MSTNNLHLQHADLLSKSVTTCSKVMNQQVRNQQVRKPKSSAGSFLDLIVYQKSEGHLLILTSIGVPNTKKKKRGSTCKGLSVKVSVCCAQFTPFIPWVNTGNKLKEKGHIVSIQLTRSMSSASIKQVGPTLG